MWPSSFNEYLKAKGYGGNNPWHDHANSGIGEDGEIASGWLMHNADKPANVRKEDSETAWLTSRAIEFLEGQSGASTPWLCHLSYVKPYWPYIARPLPITPCMAATKSCLSCEMSGSVPTRTPIYEAFTRTPVGRAFSRDDVREKVVPTYMGLIKQCDDEMGRLFAYLEVSGRMNDTMIVITSDHATTLAPIGWAKRTCFMSPR
jgi:arylsulfatase A-like enzyme